jgi:hypothetical protein
MITKYDTGEYDVGVTIEPSNVIDLKPKTARIFARCVSPGLYTLDGMVLHAAAEFSWDHPDMSYLGNGRTTPPKFPLDLLPKFWGDWCAAHARARYTPVDYTASTLLGAASGLILNRRTAMAGPEWTEAVNLWSAMVGDPSDGKSPGMQPVKALLSELERLLRKEMAGPLEEYKEALKVYEALKTKWDADADAARKAGKPLPPNEPQPPEKVLMPVVMVNDATTEALVHLLEDHDNGFIQYRDELAGWLGNMNRYAGGSGGDRQFWIEAWQGGSYDVHRVKHAVPVTIPRLNINVIGGIQPDVLSVLIKGASDGFLNRFLWTWPDIVPGFKMPKTGIDNKNQVLALKRIFELDMDHDEFGRRPKKVGLAQAAEPTFEAFVARSKARKSFGMMKATIGKGPAQALRIAMVLSLLDWSHQDGASEPIVIKEPYVKNAIKLIEDYYYPMAERAFQEASLPQVDVRARKLSQWVHKQGLEKFNAKDARRAIGGDMKESKVMDEVCGVLMDAHLIKPNFFRKGPTTGRMAKNFEVNPLVWGTDAAQNPAA